jgi:hypothetical protein
MSNSSVTFISIRAIKVHMESNSCHGPSHGSDSWLPVSHREGFFIQASTRGICGEQSSIKTFFYPRAWFTLINRHCAILLFVRHISTGRWTLAAATRKYFCYRLTPTISVQNFVQNYFGETNSACG